MLEDVPFVTGRYRNARTMEKSYSKRRTFRYTWTTLLLLFLTVVDVYSEWCGPCKAIISLFRRVKNEIGDDLLQFAIVIN